ncbi:alanine aminotransferase 1-like isoform X2 [Pithys albifrons albifrons]|uniref:alanine aminotransferase 1-like isoform X2 n=1 Tax=Pithys albifrons albifrons TaxID=3385563 RepID=UPI003A5CF25E
MVRSGPCSGRAGSCPSVCPSVPSSGHVAQGVRGVIGTCSGCPPLPNVTPHFSPPVPPLSPFPAPFPCSQCPPHSQGTPCPIRPHPHYPLFQPHFPVLTQFLPRHRPWHHPLALGPRSSHLPMMAAAEGTLGTLGTSGPPQLLECSGGDPHSMGWPPIPVLRQVLAASVYPALLDSPTTPEAVRARARRILREMDAGNIGGYNHEHRSRGVPTRVSRFLERRDAGIPCDPRNIILCSGTSSILPFVLSLVVDPGSALPTGVLVPVPGPPLLGAAAGLAGAVPIPYPLDESRGWALDAAALRRELRDARGRCRPSVLCVVNPGDPTGHVLSRRDMEAVLALAAEETLLLLADEVEQERAYDPERPFLSFRRVLAESGLPLSASVQLVSLYSLSKSVAAESGFRTGLLELVNIEEGVRQPFQLAQSIPRPCVPGRILLDLLMDPPDSGDPIAQEVEEHRRSLCRALAANARRVQALLGRTPGMRCQPLAGGPRAFPRIHIPPRARSRAADLGLEPDHFFCRRLEEDTGLVLLPGSHFGHRGGTHLGLSLLLPPATLERDLLLLTRFHAQFLREFS